MLRCNVLETPQLLHVGKFSEHVSKLKMYRTKSICLQAPPLCTGRATERSLPNITAT